MRFPEGYFDEKSAKVDSKDINRIEEKFISFAQKATFQRKLEHLPPGAARDAYLMVSFNGMKLYYSNTNTGENSFRVKTEPILDEYVALERLFFEHCDFIKGSPINPKDSFRTSEELQRDLQNAKKREKVRCLSFDSESVENLIGYRYSLTGVFGYEFYNQDVKLCSVSSIVAPDSNLRIRGFGEEWESVFEECTIVPGLTIAIQ